MTWLGSIFNPPPVVTAALERNSSAELVSDPPRHRFSTTVGDTATWQALLGNYVTGSPVSRDVALSVPAVLRARNLICSTLGALPLHCLNAANDEVYQPLLAQPESLAGRVRSHTMAMTVEDLMLSGSCLWLCIQRDVTTNFPVAVERVDRSKWSQDPETGVIIVNGKQRNDTENLILFTSPNPPLLVVGAPTIRAMRVLEATAAMYLDHPEPHSWFQPTEGQEPESDDIESFLIDDREARKRHASAYYPPGIERHEGTIHSGKEMQLVEAREFSILEIARLTGIEAEWLSISTTSRTYLNVQDARRSFVDYILSPYSSVVEQRLSLGDVTPRGQRVKVNYDAFLRASTLDRYTAHKTAIEAGFMTVDEVRAIENLPPLEAS